MPKTFDLTELAKGYFPHKFNTDENQNYVGPYPDEKYYGYDDMKTSDKEKFEKWYETARRKLVCNQQGYKTRRSNITVFIADLERAMDKVKDGEEGISVHGIRINNL